MVWLCREKKGWKKESVNNLYHIEFNILILFLQVFYVMPQDIMTANIFFTVNKEKEVFDWIWVEGVAIIPDSANILNFVSV